MGKDNKRRLSDGVPGVNCHFDSVISVRLLRCETNWPQMSIACVKRLLWPPSRDSLIKIIDR